MLSVIIETRNDEDGLARTLAALVGGAVEGMVREVLVCDRGSTDQTGKVADHAGCVWLGDADIGAAVRRAKGDWLLILEPGARPVAGWIEAVGRYVSEETQPGRFTRNRDDEHLLSRLFRVRRPLERGLLISRSQAVSLLGTGGDAASLARSVSPKGLDGQILAAPRR